MRLTPRFVAAISFAFGAEHASVDPETAGGIPLGVEIDDQDTVTLDNRGIPFLRDIPIFGYLFRFTGRKVEKTELLLLITPRVVGTAIDAAKITNDMRRATPELDEAVDRAPRAPRFTPMVPPPRPPLPGSPLPPSSPLAPQNQPPPPGGILPPPEPR